ncbi:SHOCT domain-containing protein [Salinigranum halophilum]|uniref:SHOCT domain-containing protein n=1 Tax=Salinigranum halophilum TaxID=2565931 RepID=UPI001F44F943|nr:SHOCT domain-containing protein [Salinigranum halophilum]
MTRSEPRVVTGLMLGAFLAFGIDTLVIVAGLWYVDRLSAAAARWVSVAVLAFFTLWVGVRWARLRLRNGAGDGGDTGDDSTHQRDPLEKLKQRYADGELSDAEFEERLDTLLDADRRAESTGETARLELSRDSE